MEHFGVYNLDYEAPTGRGGGLLVLMLGNSDL